MNSKEIMEIKKGDKLIFIKDGGVLSARINYVYTFSNWKGENKDKNKLKENWDNGLRIFWQCEELHNIGNHEHGFGIQFVELFNPQKYKDYIVITPELLQKNEIDFIKTFGG